MNSIKTNDQESPLIDIYIYIYIYIYIRVVTKSLCGYVSNQVQYNMESAQYLRIELLYNRAII